MDKVYNIARFCLLYNMLSTLSYDFSVSLVYTGNREKQKDNIGRTSKILPLFTSTRKAQNVINAEIIVLLEKRKKKTNVILKYYWQNLY